MPTIKDVAELAGVSTATVSNFINNTKKISADTSVRIEQAIAKLDYVPSSAGRALALHKFGGNADDKIKFNLSTSEMEIGARKNHSPILKSKLISQLAEIPNPTRTSSMMMRLIRAAQPISRVELARRLNVNRSTITTIIKPLIEADIVREGQSQSAAIGRPQVGLSFNSDKDFFIGVNIGVRGIQVGAATLSGDVIAEEEFVPQSDPEKSLDDIRSSIKQLCLKAVGRKLKVIGVSVPGPTDAERTKLLYAPHLGWRDVAITNALKFASSDDENKLVPVIVENDATAAALYEARLRLGKSHDGTLKNFILVRSGTGIGVGLVIGGEVYRGMDEGEGLAGEFGHTTIVVGGKPCVCGNRGCWERYASASAAASLYLGDRPKIGIGVPRFVEIVARAEAGEIRAKRTLEHMGEYLGVGIANVITGFGVPHVILSGRIVCGWKFIKEPLFKAMRQSMASKLSEWSVEPGEQRGGGLGGALEIAIDGFLMNVSPS